MNKGIILAAGRGSRLGALTRDRPKCMIPLGDKPLILWQTDALRGAGISEISVVRGYKGDQIDVDGVIFFENLRWPETNMVVSLTCAEAWLTQSDCIVSYADIVYCSAVIRQLMASSGAIAITYDRKWLDLWHARFDDPLTDAETFRVNEQGRLLEIGARAKRLDDIEGQYMGLLKFTPPGWQMVSDILQRLEGEERDRLDMTTLLRLCLDNNVAIHTVPVDGGWGEVDNENDLALYERMLAEGGAFLGTE